ncbi:MAG: hypothetical protein N2039_05410, partial [Gemmataceae bacterium]|nr:hypothetical protein [Gemmataceae bacterium]
MMGARWLAWMWAVSATAALMAQAPSNKGPGDWPQWRGPKRDDISQETGLLKSWPRGGPPLAY